MPSKLDNIEYGSEKKNPYVDAGGSGYYILFEKSGEYFVSMESFVKFVKGVERIVRLTKYYKRYIKFIKTDLGLNFCQVLHNVKDMEDDENEERSTRHKKDDNKIEMHHGPLLTLFDCCSIVCEYLLIKGKFITTFDVADIIIKEHFNHNIQIVMLSKTMHEAVHAGEIFISIEQGFGNVSEFLKRYGAGLQPEQIIAIDEYIKMSKENGSFDKNVLTVQQIVKKYEENFI